MSRPALLALALLLTTAVLPAPVSGQSCDTAAILLSGSTTTPYCTIQAAIDAASPFDSVLVIPTTVAHLEALVVPSGKHNLTLCAADAAGAACATSGARPVIDASGTGASYTLELQAADVNVSHLAFQGARLLVLATGADRLVFVDNALAVTVSVVSAQHGIDVRRADAPSLAGNQIVGNMYPGSISIALRDVMDGVVADNRIERSGTSVYVRDSTAVEVARNHITVPSVNQFAADSLAMSFFRGGGHLVHHNRIEGAGAGLSLKGATDVTAHNDTMTTTITGVRLSATGTGGSLKPTGLVLRDEGLAGTETAIRFTSGFDEAHEVHVDAACNDWGAYTAATIATRIKDEVGDNSVSVQPWKANDPDVMRCLTPPAAAIGLPPAPYTRLAAVDFQDATTVGSRSILSWAWDLGDGDTSSERHPSHLYEQVGTYTVSLVVTDAVGMVDRAEVPIDIEDLLPVFTPIADRTVAEGEPLGFDVTTVDPEDDPVTLSLDPMPTGLVFTDHGDGTARFEWTPDHDQAGVYGFTVTADDGIGTNTTTFQVTVGDVDGPPALDPVGDHSVAEDSLLTIQIHATEPDGQPIALAAFVLPPGASFTDHGDGNGTFSWRPTYFQAGTYDLTFQASDGLLVDKETIVITVTNVNRPPVLDPVGDRSVEVGDTLSFFVSGSDPDGEALTYRAEALPPGATFDAARRLFSYTPLQDHAGDWENVTFIVSDGALVDSEPITVTVVLLEEFRVRLDPVDPTAFLAVGGKTVSVRIDVMNLGTTDRNYTLGVGPVPFGWNVVLDTSLVFVPAGGSVQVTLSVTPNDDHLRRELFVTADDLLSEAELKVIVAVPITLKMEITQTDLDKEVRGRVFATYFDGSPVKKRPITVIENPKGLLQVVTTVSGTTDPDGVYFFKLPFDPMGSNRPGPHTVQAQSESQGGMFRAVTEYSVGA